MRRPKNIFEKLSHFRGGLVAAASQRTGIEAKTYNAAGVYQLTNFGSNDKGDSNIDNYYIRGEILSFSQNGAGLGWLMPNSIGRQHALEPAEPFPTSFGYQNLSYRVELHSMRSVKKSMGLKQ
ncbi:hypothetical protein [Psychrobacter sp. I-STPA10]|uniref:hypothetical protein n=1 Tax=Psychrobacter sp. I-STPA10 TaxID=2585769 RepID=UPI001E55C77A|nr:hypothetical protein [Psychrobacter sp. I-STPA10]